MKNNYKITITTYFNNGESTETINRWFNNVYDNLFPDISRVFVILTDNVEFPNNHCTVHIIPTVGNKQINDMMRFRYMTIPLKTMNDISYMCYVKNNFNISNKMMFMSYNDTNYSLFTTSKSKDLTSDFFYGSKNTVEKLSFDIISRMDDDRLHRNLSFNIDHYYNNSVKEQFRDMVSNLKNYKNNR